MINRIDELGYAAWDCYYTELFQHFKISHGRKQFWDNKYYKVFRRIGKLCEKNDIDPYDYISVNFNTLWRYDHRYITPRDFATQHALDRYTEYASILGDQALSSWLTQVGVLADLETRLIPELYNSEEEILLNYQTPFLPWFRVLYPKPFSIKIFDIYGEHAYRALQKDKRLRTIMRERAKDNFENLEKKIGYFGGIKKEY